MTRGNNSKKAEYIVAIATFLLGFCIWVAYSLTHNVFWTTSPHEFPTIIIPSLMIGDAIFLPIINFYFVRLIKYQLQESYFREYKKQVFIIFIAALVISIAINSYSHYSWSHDPYVGMIDTPEHRLSPAGWWHYIFSNIEMTAIFLFAANWIFLIRLRDAAGFKLAVRTFYWIVAFTALSIGDFAVQHFYIFRDPSLWYALKTGWWELLTISGSLLFLILMRHRKKRMEPAH